MDLEEYINHKIYSDILPDNSFLLYFMSKTRFGIDTGRRPHPDLVYDCNGRKVYTMDSIPLLYEEKYKSESFYMDKYGKVGINSIDLRNIKNIPNKKIYLNHSYEPIQYKSDAFFWNNSVLDYHDAKGMPSELLGTVRCNPNIGDKLFLLHSERESTDIQTLTQEITVQNIRPVYWFANGYTCATEWYKQYGLKVFDDFESRPIRYKFVCATRLYSDNKKYRLELLNKLDLTYGAYSLLKHCPYTGQTPNQVLESNHVKPHSFDEHGNESAYIEMRYETAFNTSFLHVVMGTLFTEEKHHLTEKVFKPIVLQQPFVLVAPRGCLGYLKSYGFRTFDNWWDESYDDIKDPNQRLDAVAEIINYVANLDWEDLYRMRTEMTEVLQHNRRLFYGSFATDCWHELKRNIKEFDY